MRYFITFSCYGQHLHGHESGSIDRHRNLYGAPFVQDNPRRAAAERLKMTQPPYFLDQSRQPVVLEALRKVCLHRSWNLLAAHVRTTHVHAIVEAAVRPEKIMNDFKAYASRRLNDLEFDQPDRKRWSRHGSARWLWKDEDVRDAIRYVIEEQGEPLALFVTDSP